MTIDSQKTLVELQKFNDHIAKNEDYLLKVVKGNDGRSYVNAVPRNEMSLWQRILSLVGWSDFNLNNVLEVLSQTAQENVPQDKRNVLIQVSTHLQQKVKTHYHNNIQQKAVVEKLQSINSLKIPSVKDGLLGDQYIEPDARIAQALSNPKFHPGTDPQIYEQINESLGSAWHDNAELLLEYVNKNAQQLDAMFAGKPFALHISIDSSDPLSQAQLKLLRLLPITTLVLDGNVEGRDTQPLQQLFNTIPDMKKLTNVNALMTRYLPASHYGMNFYSCLSNITNFSARMSTRGLFSNDLEAVVKNMPNLKEFHINVENDSGPANHENTLSLKQATKLEELTLNGSAKGGYLDITECFMNIPEQCRKVRLYKVSVDLTNKQLTEQFRNKPLDILYLYGYGEESIKKFKDAKIAKEIVVETRMAHHMRYV